MDEHIKNRWVAALREPGQKQARGCMKDSEGGRCCLGVLEEVVLGMPLFEGQMLLSIDARVTAGLHENDARTAVSSSEGGFHPPSANDGCSVPAKTFPEIADLIEQHWRDM